jgi:predicted amino acid racemase
MFLEKTIRRNPALIKTSFDLHQSGQIMPDTYVIDLDMIIENAKNIIDSAKKHDLKMYFMLKQLGRNPIIAKELIKLGYSGAVAVDFNEALVYMDHNIPISNVGHLVQPPKALLQKLIDYQCEYITIYSIEKACDINEYLKNTNRKQKVMLRIISDQDRIYSGQHAGFHIDELEETIKELIKLEHIDIKGLTSFPCFLYNENTNKNEPTENLNTILKAKEIVEKFGINIENLNAPSTTCVETIEEMAKYPVNSGEPGHGLSGTTPLHAVKDSVEIPAVTYVSEVSHNLAGKSFCYGGGHYRRSHVDNALVGSDLDYSRYTKVIAPDLDSIDYHFGLSDLHTINETVIMAFRFQIFVTRSTVCIVKGIQSGNPEIVGFYNSLGSKI